MLKEDDVRAWTVTFLATMLQCEAESIKSDVNFNVMGLSSVDAVIMAGAMEEHFDIEIDAALFLRNSTINSLIADLQASGIVG
ncbi:acyl carrier protein [Rhizobium oryziradicis]|uniref:Carrier domain-containing protein n=1 Tax=Rhizobium oryziradicis TaxID=1867956 RepID=A0A1Q8ZXH4_9HYPH|nr:acyl carrier protein [Rhizobium oryziradicis]OLP46741.1 hypothetical protein BJF95_15605 [Rhizobium oryziradicis]